jgi:exosortase/archaeosortase family protein
MPRQIRRYDRARSQLLQLPRAKLFAGLFILGCANGLAAQMGQSVHQLGFAGAIFDTFSISVIVLVACFAGVSLILHDKMDEMRFADVAVGAVFLMLVILPIGQLSWLAVSGLSLHILLFTDANQSGRRGAIILLASTVPMLWSKLLFHFFSKFILEIDAALVGWMLGTHRNGNMVEFADHSGSLVILPPCSSLANMSLAFLCWVTVSQSVRHRWRPQDLLWCLLACASVVAVNVTRISLMGLSHSYYSEIHSQWGDVTANVIIFCLTVGISVLGVKREVFSRT